MSIGAIGAGPRDIFRFQALRISRKRIDEQLVRVLPALLPCWVKRRGVLEPCGLLRSRRGRALDDGSWVENRLERLCNPAESGVASVIESKGAEGHGKLLDKFVDKGLPWRRRFRFHLFGVIEGHTKLYLLFRRIKKCGQDTAHPKDLAFIILCDFHALDADDLLVGKHFRLYFAGSCFPGFPGFCLYQYFLLLSL